MNFSEIISYKFKNDKILEEALTHPSVGRKHDNRAFNYQRLEFLGDSILSMVISEMLFKLFPEDNEGFLAKKKVALVCGSTLGEIAGQINLGEFIIMAEGERQSGGEFNLRNLENTLEALIGAIYLDSGIRAAKKFILKHWKPLAKNMLVPPQDSKTILQELVQGEKLPIPVYKVVEQSGPAHKPNFNIVVCVEKYGEVSACASNKKLAEQKAAALMLDKIYKQKSGS